MKNRFSSAVCLVLAAALVIGPAGSSFGRDLDRQCAFEGDPTGGFITIGEPINSSGGATESGFLSDPSVDARYDRNLFTTILLCVGQHWFVDLTSWLQPYNQEQATKKAMAGRTK
jgi:hypothetical protein